VSPAHVERRIIEALAKALVLRDAAGCCRSDQNSLRTRLLDGAYAIDELANLLRAQTFVAQLNHDVIVARAEA
jgi:hypothetical protein